MCGNGLIGMGRMALRETTAATPATTPLEHLGVATKASAEPLVTGEHRVPRVPAADAA
jgi:hypothetical protein